MSTTIRDGARAVLVNMMDRLGLSPQLESGVATTLFIDGLRITLVPNDNTLRLVFKLADLPTEAWARESKLLEAARFAAGNLANLERDRETLTVSENAAELLLFRVVSVDQLDVDQCLEQVAQFVDAAEYWQRAIGSPALASQS